MGNEFKKTMTNFEKEKNIFNQEKEKWLAAKGSVDEEKQRLQTLQQTMTERYEAEFDKFVMETQEQRNVLSLEYTKLNKERVEFQEMNDIKEQKMNYTNSLPPDIQKLRKELESEKKENKTISQKLKKMMNTMSKKEKEIESDHAELLQIKQQILELEEEKKAELKLLNNEDFQNEQQIHWISEQKKLETLQNEFEVEKAEFERIKKAFYDDLDPMDWKQKYLIMKNDFDAYCDEMDAYCDNLEGLKQNAEDKYHDLYSSFDAENTQLTEAVNKKNEIICKQEERLRELEEAEEMWQHHMAENEKLVKESDDTQKKFDRISDEMATLHEQINNYKAQLSHFVDIEAELDELKKQYFA